MTIRDTGGFFAGLLFFTVGLSATMVARGYAIGSALHMGPGYFPVALGILLMIVGMASIVRSLSVTVESAGSIAWRPLLTISAAVAVFAVGIDLIGLIPTVFVSALVASMAVPRPKFVEAGLIAATLSVLAAGIFFYGLKLPFSLF